MHCWLEEVGMKLNQAGRIGVEQGCAFACTHSNCLRYPVRNELEQGTRVPVVFAGGSAIPVGSMLMTTLSTPHTTQQMASVLLTAGKCKQLPYRVVCKASPQYPRVKQSASPLSLQAYELTSAERAVRLLSSKPRLNPFTCRRCQESATQNSFISNKRLEFLLSFCLPCISA